MNEGRTVFAQLMDCLPKYEFDKCVRRYGGNVRVRSLATYEQFLVMAFAQLTWRESLRDIETCLRALGSKLYHSGIRKPTARSTLADANEKRDWRIFADFARILIEQVSQLYADEPWVPNSPPLPTPWIPPPSIFASRCFPGPSSGVTMRLSKCMPCSRCAALIPPWLLLLRPVFTTSTFSIRSIIKPVRSM